MFMDTETAIVHLPGGRTSCGFRPGELLAHEIVFIEHNDPEITSREVSEAIHVP